MVLRGTAANLAVLAGGKNARMSAPGQNGQTGCCATQDRADWRAHQLLGRQSPDTTPERDQARPVRELDSDRACDAGSSKSGLRTRPG